MKRNLLVKLGVTASSPCRAASRGSVAHVSISSQPSDIFRSKHTDLLRVGTRGRYQGLLASLLGARTLLGAKGITCRPS